ncbi:bacteriocin [Ohtaekwangia koreensis]|uniref:Bacteriocin-type signal sequence-containing protein n=1 Tax=Ohtaekwangia koreensis TaxID=688867 RepID=A0A1T5ITS2_9BACT|nr:bacteriocin [Ohtaekwangia koreensis]SKC42597.1 bacteriocin-type signal sequence-containing protein [Ohtaekwangia koreensis]
MDFVKGIERIRKANLKIRNQHTGNPKVFASSLGISKRQLYNIFDFFKAHGATIKYSRSLQTFYYPEDFDIIINFSVKTINEKEMESISGGAILSCPSIQFYYTEGHYF